MIVINYSYFTMHILTIACSFWHLKIFCSLKKYPRTYRLPLYLLLTNVKWVFLKTILIKNLAENIEN